MNLRCLPYLVQGDFKWYDKLCKEYKNEIRELDDMIWKAYCTSEPYIKFVTLNKPFRTAQTYVWHEILDFFDGNGLEYTSEEKTGFVYTHIFFSHKAVEVGMNYANNTIVQ